MHVTCDSPHSDVIPCCDKQCVSRPYCTAGVRSVSDAREAAASLYEDVTPQDSFTSASGFYSPRSQMASRRQSASSSDAWYDATSQMTSRTPSVTAPAPSAMLPSSQSTGNTTATVSDHSSHITACRSIRCTHHSLHMSVARPVDLNSSSLIP